MTDEAERRRVERVLAVARAYLAVLASAAIYLDPTEPSRYVDLTYTLLAVYVLSSMVILYAVGSATRITAQFTNFIHLTDIVWMAVITSLTAGPNSPFFAFTIFALLAAGYRWGLKESLVTALLCAQVLLLQSFPWGQSTSSFGEFPITIVIMRTTYTFIIAFLVGFLADAEKQWRGEAAALARIMQYAQTERGLRAALQPILADMMSLFAATRIDVAARDAASGAMSIWRLDRRRPESLQLIQDKAEAAQPLLAPELPAAMYVRVQAKKGGPRSFIALDPAGKRAADAQPDQAAAFTRRCGAQTVLTATYSDAVNLTTRVILINPEVGHPRSDLRFLQTLVHQVGPGLNNMYLLGRLRSRIGAVERSRVARELHDGAIQTIIGLEMEIEAMRRRLGADDPVKARLTRVKDLLHEEAVTLRELMQQMKPLDLRNTDFVAFLATTVDRFGRDTGIASSFASALDELQLPPRIGRELGRIVQEALSNIRRHACAGNISVRLRLHESSLVLIIDDDGRGFGFSGRLAGAELDRSSIGPLSIKERARGIGAELAIESLPTVGSRVEIRLPLSRAGLVAADQPMATAVRDQ